MSDDAEVLCPACAESIPSEYADFEWEDGAYVRYDCPSCGDVSYEETIASRAQRVADGELEPEDAFSWYDANDTETADILDELTEKRAHVDVGPNVQTSCAVCGIALDELAAGERFRRLTTGEMLCPEHVQEALDDGAELRYPDAK